MSEEWDGWSEKPVVKSDPKEKFKQIAARVRNKVVEIGKKVENIATQTVEKVGDTISKVSDKVGDTFNKVGEKVGDTFSKVGDKMGDMIAPAKLKIEEKIIEKRKFDDAVEQELARIRESEKSSKDVVWEDISSTSTKYNTPKPESQSIPKSQKSLSTTQPSFNSPSSESMILGMMTPEMKVAYLEAESAMKDNQESVAVQYYEYIIELAKKEKFQSLIDFIEVKIKNIYNI